MRLLSWQQMRLIERVRWLRFVLPPLLVFIVVFYQLGIAQTLETYYGHTVHYGVEVAFYSLTGPVVTWLMLVWVERKLGEQARLEQQIQAAERERTSILEEERVRIARDLHDGMAQTVYFLALKTDILRQRIAADAEAVQELREMGKALRQIIRDVRRTIFALRPLDWSQAGFLPALVGFVDDFAEQMDWEAVAVIDAAVQVPIRLEPTVFRLVQESLNNVAKHARATVVRVTLANEDDGYLRIIVEDNGRGFDQTGKNGGLGLNQMADRVSAVGGVFRIESEPGKGTIVTSQIPLAGVSDG